MAQAVGAGGTATYTYNGDGLKVQRVGPDGATRYYYDGIRPIWETDGAGAMTAQLDRDLFGNLLSRREASGTRRYYHTDGLGSTVALTDEAGASAASMLYDAWGNVRVSGGTGLGKYRFTGAELDTASDLYHMGARFYDPSIGRWLSEDPVQGDYTYAADNSLVLIDPTGMMEGDSNTCDAVCVNAQRNAAAAAAGNSDAYRAWLGAVQRGVTPPSGWEKYIEMVLAASREYGVPADLILAVMAAETGSVHYDPNYVNPTNGDTGLMQVLASTAKNLGFDSNLRTDPATNIRMGAKLLRELLDRYGGNEFAAVSSYNIGCCGPHGFDKFGAWNNYHVVVGGFLGWFRRTRCGGYCP